MKVLWFTNVQMPAVCRRLALPVPIAGGWMESLRFALANQDSLKLAMAAAGPTPFEPFEDEGVRYFHVQAPPTRSGFGGLSDRWLGKSADSQIIANAAAVSQSFRPDLIHVHGSERAFGLLSEMLEVPLVISVQGLLVVCSRFCLTGIPRKELVHDVISIHFAKGRGLVHTWRGTRGAAERELKILRSCHYFAGRTAWDRDIVRVVNPESRYYHVDEVLRSPFYDREWVPRADGPFTVYATGGTAPWKGLVSLLDGVALLRQSVRRETRLRVAGALQETDMWPVIQRRVNMLGLSNVVEWLGPLAPEAIASELQSASVYVQPSVVENSSNALAEAMAMGAPCVATSGGGTPSMISDGVDGLLCAPNDIYGLAGKMAAIEADAVMAANLGRNARIRAQQRHDPNAIAAATLNMYQDIVARHRRGSSAAAERSGT